jgi:uncharacterized protein (TIGR00251 family)
MTTALSATAHGTRILLHVVPRASRTAVVGEHDGRIKLQVAAPPVDGEANDAIVRFFAKALGLRRDDVVISAGQTGRKKTVEIAGLDPAAVLVALGLG